MEPFCKEFYTLKSLISNIKVEVILDDFVAEEDGFIDGYISDIYANGEYPTIKRYDVRINGIYHKIFLDDLVNAFNEFNEEIKYNLNARPLKDSIPTYLKKLTDDLIIWFDNIIEHEVKLNSQIKWFYLPKNLDQSFMLSDGIDSSIIGSISSIFIFIKNSILEILESIEKFETADFGKKEIHIPEDLFSNVLSPSSTTGVLDIYQTALFFYYLKKHKGINPVSAQSLARLVSALTGHSEHNIRTEKGFGAIANIFADKVKNQKFNDIPNYNLIVLKTFLQGIINDIENQEKKNHPELTKL
jgi:hypothetical protein